MFLNLSDHPYFAKEYFKKPECENHFQIFNTASHIWSILFQLLLFCLVDWYLASDVLELGHNGFWEIIMCFSLQLPIEFPYIGGFISAMERIFTPWK